MKKNKTVARMTTPTRAAIAIPATAPLLSDEESCEFPPSDGHASPEQPDESESLEVIVTMSSSAFSSQLHADTLKVSLS
jgi:hypothetical protein